MDYSYFQNRDCEYYPCHNMKDINCLFCFCPLYLIENCGGNYKMIFTDSGKQTKDCSNCCLPHKKDGYEYVIEKLKENIF